MLLLANCSPGHMSIKPLAAHIMQLSATYDLDAADLAKLVIVESKCHPEAINHKSHDFGLVQINIKTAVNMGLNISQLMDWRYNLTSAAQLLVQLQKSTHYRPCSYNIGPRNPSQNASLENKCLLYEQKLAKLSTEETIN
jgi:Transglycosylase SLT domain